LAILYALLATLVLRLFAINGVVSVAWPPSGLALAALLLGGKKYAPGIWLGAWVSNLLAGSSPLVSAIIALGNTLEPLVSIWLLGGGWLHGVTTPLNALRELLRLIFLGAFGASTVSALIGATTLLTSGFIGSDAYWLNLIHWWMGDALGIVLITPLILAWRQAPPWRTQGRLPEATLLLGLSFLVGQVVFLGWFSAQLGSLALGFWMFLFVTWAALRLGAHGVTALLSIIAVQALWGAHLNVGFFADDIMNSNLTAYWLHAGISLGRHGAGHLYRQPQARQNTTDAKRRATQSRPVRRQDRQLGAGCTQQHFDLDGGILPHLWRYVRHAAQL
jgi:integral membrane sensor domain MASE1